MNLKDLFEVNRDGYVKASQLVQVLEPMVVEIAEQLREQRALIKQQDTTIEAMKHEVEYLKRLSRAPGARRSA